MTTSGSHHAARHELRDDSSGQFVKTQPCDGCGKPTGRDYFTDDEVCGGSDGPGFYLCGRKRCCAKREHLSVEARRELYTRVREEGRK